MRYLFWTLTLLLSFPVLAADYAREKKWADEILPAVLVGDPVWLEQTKGPPFLGLYAPATQPRGAVILVHGIGVHPDWGLISALRQQLPDAGYSTLSVQMPILKVDAKPEDYPPTFPEAAERLKQSVAWLKGKGYRKVAIVSHSLGSPMTYPYLTNGGESQTAAFVAIGTPWIEGWGKLGLPILDLYGDRDLPQVLTSADKRAAGLRHPGSRQVMVPAANHFFDGQDQALLEQVRGFLDKTL
ncbi:MAG: alpha/beta hydrolase family protein [Thiobacillaceae bacterium]|jgi:pimeloyl-ACP methyl ester carboxylesterase|nr:alpha/beta hydrolase family protein [Thiobacillaceae bacterium]